MRYFPLILLLALFSCGQESGVHSTIAEPQDTMRNEYKVRLVYCDATKGDTVITIITFDGYPPTPNDISSLNEPVPVYRAKGGAVFNVCGLEVIGKKTHPGLEGSRMILQDSVSSTK